MKIKKGYNNTDYDRLGKNMQRAKIAAGFKTLIKNKDVPLVTLETSQWLFVKEFPETQNFLCYQIDEKEYKTQIKNKPKNVSLLFENCNNIEFPIHYAYFDYCNTWSSNAGFIRKIFMRNLICDNAVLAFTFSQRDKHNDKFPLETRIRYSIKNWAKAAGYNIYKYKPEGYRDTSAMLSIFFVVKKIK